MTRFQATVQVTVRDEGADMLRAMTGLKPRTTFLGTAVPSASAEITVSVESDDASEAIADALRDAAALAHDRSRWR